MQLAQHVVVDNDVRNQQSEGASRFGRRSDTSDEVMFPLRVRGNASWRLDCETVGKRRVLGRARTAVEGLVGQQA